MSEKGLYRNFFSLSRVLIMAVLLCAARFFIIYIFDNYFLEKAALSGFYGIFASEAVKILAWLVLFGLYDFLFVRKKKSSFENLIPLPIAAVYFGAYFLSAAFQAVFSYIFNSPKGSQTLFFSSNKFSEIVLLFIVTSLMVPAVEEYVFRRVILRSFAEFGFCTAALCSSAVFAACHSPDNMVYAFVFGIALSYLAAARGCRVSFLAHALNNALALSISLAEERMPEKISFVLTVFYILVCFAGIISLIFLAVFVLRRIKITKNKNEVLETCMKINEIWNIKEKQEFVTEMFEYISEKCKNGEKIEDLNDKQRVFYIVQTLEMEVNNGGFSQFFFNSNGIFAGELISSFKKIGAIKTAEICKKAVSIFGDKIYADRNELQDFLVPDDEEEEEKIEEILNECDDAFFEYEDDLTELNYQFIIDNKESFLN